MNILQTLHPIYVIICEYLNEFWRLLIERNMIEEPRVLLALIIASCSYYFILYKFISEMLHKTLSLDLEENKLEYLHIYSTSKSSLVLGNITGKIIFICILGAWFLDNNNGYYPIIGTLRIFIPPLVAVHLFTLVMLQSLIGIKISKIEAKRLEQSLSVIKSVVCLKNGKRLSGGLINLDILKGFKYLYLRLDSGAFHAIDKKEIAHLYLQKNRINDSALSESKFKQGPNSLRLENNLKEQFNSVRHYDTNGFFIFNTNRIDTNTKYIICPKSEAKFITQ